MDFRTVINIEPSALKITYHDPAMFIGSCFALSIGKKFESGRMPAMINPSGTVFNPASVRTTLDHIIKGTELSRGDLFEYKGRWVSFDHYTDFSATDPGSVLQKINSATRLAHNFLKRAKFLFITFGTARVYKLKDSGKIVSNCHKIPASYFINELLTVEDITNSWLSQLDILSAEFPELKVIFTISPVRHWKDGAHGNMVSKSSLFLSVEELLKHPSAPVYFPAYELLMDDLRDYRFYDSDLLHPSGEAVDYIWGKFTGCFFDNYTLVLWKEIEKITRSLNHLIKGDDKAGLRQFSSAMLGKIALIEEKVKGIDFTTEKDYFGKLI